MTLTEFILSHLPKPNKAADRVEEIAARLRRSSVTGMHIATDPSLVPGLIELFQALGLPCLATRVTAYQDRRKA